MVKDKIIHLSYNRMASDELESITAQLYYNIGNIIDIIPGNRLKFIMTSMVNPKNF